MPDELPDLKNAFHRALSADVQRRVINGLQPAPPTTVIQNIARFNQFVAYWLLEKSQCLQPALFPMAKEHTLWNS
jgi:hypothetical protein